VNEPSAKLSSLCLGVVILAVVLSAPASVAAETIGTASSVQPEVNGGGSAINSGDSVTQGELIKSGPGGSARILFTDGTSLSIGASSQVTMSHFVHADKQNFQKAAFLLAKGAFRFTTGHSDKSAYHVTTPTSTLSVRGTEFSVDVEDKSTTVGVTSGEVLFCRAFCEASGNKKSGECQIVRAGQTATYSCGKISSSNILLPEPLGFSSKYIPPFFEGCPAPNCPSIH